MKRSVVSIFWVSVLWTCFVACTTDDPKPERLFPPETPEHGDNSDSDTPENDNEETNAMGNRIQITIGDTSFDVTLEDNAAVDAFKALLPMTLHMSELNGNEKYYYLSKDLPIVPSRPNTIHSGDLMLYGSSCIVLFYETFSTSYSYTRLGRIDHPLELASTLGSGSVNVTFALP